MKIAHSDCRPSNPMSSPLTHSFFHAPTFSPHSVFWGKTHIWGGGGVDLMHFWCVFFWRDLGFWEGGEFLQKIVGINTAPHHIHIILNNQITISLSSLIILNPRTPRGRGWIPPPLAFFPCNFFDDSNRKNRLSVSVTRDGRHILTYVTSSWRCHVTYVMTSYVHDGGQNTLFLRLFVNRDNFWCRCNKVMRLVFFSTKLRS